jgi:hypothetical protein
MNHKGSLLCSQELSNGIYCRLIQSSPSVSLYLSEIQFNIILPSAIICKVVSSLHEPTTGFYSEAQIVLPCFCKTQLCLKLQCGLIPLRCCYSLLFWARQIQLQWSHSISLRTILMLSPISAFALEVLLHCHKTIHIQCHKRVNRRTIFKVKQR